jgi:hypothetical protein
MRRLMLRKKEFNLTSWAVLTVAGLGMLGLLWFDPNSNDWWYHFYFALGMIALAPVSGWLNAPPQTRLDHERNVKREVLVLGGFTLVGSAFILSSIYFEPYMSGSAIGWSQIIGGMLLVFTAFFLVSRGLSWIWRGLSRRPDKGMIMILILMTVAGSVNLTGPEWHHVFWGLFGLVIGLPPLVLILNNWIRAARHQGHAS